MYKKIIRPILFWLFSPEQIHHIVVGMLKFLRYIPGYRWCLSKIYTVKHPALEREVFGITFPNPVGLAAGFDKNADIFDMLSSFGFGHIEVGAITPKAQRGNPRPRLFRLPADKALINRMGFNNKGVARAAKYLKRLEHRSVIGANLGKNTLTCNENAAADYLKVFRLIYDYTEYFVINVSCPNVANLGKLQSKDSLREIIEGMIDFRKGQNQYRPMLLKISPDLNNEQIDDAIEVMKQCNLDGIVATNTTTKRDKLVNSSREMVTDIGNGGLSGAPLTERSIEVVKYVYEKTSGKYPIIGVGGIMSEADALAMLDAGASLIQIYTGFIYNGPSFAKSICRELIKREESRGEGNDNNDR